LADKKISELVSATTVNTTDYFPIVQGGTTLKLDMATFLSHLPAPAIELPAQESPASGALSTAVKTSLITSATGATNYTLAAGTHGMKKVIAAQTMGGSATAIVTVTSGTGFTTLTFNTAGDYVSLENINGFWFISGNTSVVAA
jgi:hypothetical protein